MTSANGGGENRVSGGPRAEARPLDWHEMTEDQRWATRRILDLVDAMAKETTAGNIQGESRDCVIELVLPRIDQARSNRVALIDGDRGTGKTAVLLSILGHWNNAIRGRPQPKVQGPMLDSKLVAESLQKVYTGSQVVPLEILDLQPLPKSTHLLAHIATRLRPIAEAIQRGLPGEGTIERTAWQTMGTRSGAFDAWRGFMSTVVIGWDDVMKGRSGGLDLESYVDELQQVEADRMDVRSSFGKLMDCFAKDFASAMHWRDRAPLFVLPIDDGDMNVMRVPELIDIIRMLWHPRFAIVLAGDSELFELVLRHSVLRDIRLGSAASDSGRTPAFEDGSLEKAAKISRQIFSKSVPESQRFALSEIAVRDRWEVHFDSDVRGAESGRGTSRVSMNSLVCRIDDLTHDGRLPLSGYMKALPELLLALPGNLRQLQEGVLRADSVWFGWSEAIMPTRSAEGTTTARTRRAATLKVGDRNRAAALRDLWRHAIEDDAKSLALRSRSRDVLFDTDDGSIRVRSGEFRLRADWRGIHTSSSGSGTDLTFQTLAHWWIEPPGGSGLSADRPQEAASLSGASTSALVAMMHEDALTDGPFPPFNEFGSVSVFDRYCISSVRFLSRAAESRDTAEGAIWDDVLPISWPVPDWVSPLDAIVVERRWRESCLGSAWGAGHIDHLARTLVGLVLDQAELADPTIRLNESETQAPKWSELAPRVARLGVQRATTPRAKSFAVWARSRVALLGAPECGLPPESAMSWLKLLRKEFGERLWASALRDELVIARNEMIRRGVAHRMVPLRRRPTDEAQIAIYRNAIDEVAATDHPWLKFAGVGVAGRAPTKDVADLIQSLGNLVGSNRLSGFVRRRLSRAPRNAVDVMRRVLEENRFGSVPTARIIAELWHASISATKQQRFGKAVRVVPGDEQRIETNGLRFTRETVEHPTRQVALPGDLVVGTYEIGEIRVTVDDLRLQSPCDAVYSIATDYAASNSVIPTPRRVGFFPWEGVRCMVGDNGPEFYWPALYWFQYGDVSEIEDAWNEALRQIDQRELRSVSDPQWRVDAMLYSCLQNTRRLLGESSVQTAHFTGEPTGQNWQTLLRDLVTWKKSKPEMVDHGDYATFRRELGLFATPELGVSPAVAGHVLTTVLGVGGETVDTLKALRVEWAARFCDSPDAIRPIFTHLRSSFPEHPWYDRVDRIEAPSDEVAAPKVGQRSARASTTRKDSGAKGGARKRPAKP